MIWRVIDLLHALICFLLWPVRFLPWGRKRANFESLRTPHIGLCDWSFEVSSEGEFEQVKPWIMSLLKAEKKVELVYASESVHKTVTNLQQHYSNQLRLIPLPLLTHTPWSLVRALTAPRLVLCRYDFFPSLMARTSVVGVSSGLVWASFKRRRHRMENVWWRRWYRLFYGSFNWVVPATREDEKLFNALGGIQVLSACEMRVPQIQFRLQEAATQLLERFPHWSVFFNLLSNYPYDSRWIMGSAWESDLGLLDDPKLRRDLLDKKTPLTIVPHKLGAHWKELLRARGFDVLEITSTWNGEIPESSRPLVVVLNLKGVLCELYSVMGHAYVGGGFERSVHSVLEPFVAGCKIICGPMVHRSTEVEAIQAVAPLALTVIPDQTRLSVAYADLIVSPPDLTLRTEWLDNQSKLLKSNLHEVMRLC
jgi:3-deoxy-D-manno-octulosonic-acid transferase